MRRGFSFLLLALSGCKTVCDRSVDHIVHLVYEESKPELAKMGQPQPSEADLRGLFVEHVREELGERCSDPAVTACILAAEDSTAVRECVPPVAASDGGALRR